MARTWTGNPSSLRESTAAWASGYVAKEAISSPRGRTAAPGRKDIPGCGGTGLDWLMPLMLARTSPPTAPGARDHAQGA